MLQLVLDPKTTILRPYELSTAEILYFFPDHPNVLQSFVWQDYDIAPRYPVLLKFLRFWEAEIEGKLHSVSVASREIRFPFDLKAAAGDWLIH